MRHSCELSSLRFPQQPHLLQGWQPHSMVSRVLQIFCAVCRCYSFLRSYQAALCVGSFRYLVARCQAGAFLLPAHR